MAKYLTQTLLMLSMLHCSVSFAGELRDPTMPPASLGQQGVEVEVVNAGPVLQSVTLGTVTKSAMISGETVMLGEHYEDYVLMGLKADEAKLLALDGSSLVLKMDFNVIKKPLYVSKKNHVSHRGN